MTHKVTTPLPVRSNTVLVFRLAVASVLTVMLIGQLFGYEDFASVLLLSLPVGLSSQLITTLAAVIVCIELLALVYFLELALSWALRAVAASAALLTAVGWVFLSVVPVLQNQAGGFAMFGPKLEVPIGPIAILFSLLLAIVIIGALMHDFRFARLEKTAGK